MLRLTNLRLENVGPFENAQLIFLDEDLVRETVATDPHRTATVTLITGKNGTGKSILIDAIRGAFGPEYGRLERNIVRDTGPFLVEVGLWSAGQRVLHANTSSVVPAGSGADDAPFQLYPFLNPSPSEQQLAIPNLPNAIASGSRTSGTQPFKLFVIDLWRSNLPRGTHSITSLSPLNVSDYLVGSLSGRYENTDTTQFLCQLDYLRGSQKPDQKQAAEVLFTLATEIVSDCLMEGGSFSYVDRATLTPYFKQAGQEVPLSNLSSGNAYLLNRLLGLLRKAYAVHVLEGTPASQIRETPGVVLIDEAENHLHPQWQRRLIPIIRKHFPNLQLVVATHSPFVVSSVKDARVYVCESEGERCVVKDESGSYANKSVAEILSSPVFSETYPYSEDVSKLLEQRDEAIAEGDEKGQLTAEEELKKRNPIDFGYFDLDRRIAALARQQP